MRLHRLILQNVAQHERLDVSFDSGLIAILGPNGSGKSNVLNAAYAALSGDFTRHSGGKAGLIRQGSTGESSIEIHAEHAGMSLVLYRGLRPSKQWLVFDGKTYDKAASITEVLSDCLGVTPDLLNTYVFVAQWELFGFLGTPTERARSIARLCQTDRVERLWEILGRQMEQDRPLGRYVGEDPATLQKELAAAQEELDDAEEALAAAQEACVPEDEVRGLSDLLRRWDEQTLLQAQREECAEQLEVWRGRLEEAAAELETAQQRWQDLADALATREAEAQDARVKLEMLETASKLAQARARIEKRLAALQEPLPPEGYDEDWPSSADVERRLAEQEAKLARQRDFVRRCQGKPACPVCGTASETFAGALDEAQRSLPRLEAEARRLRDELQAVRRFEADCRRYDEARLAWEKTRAELREQLATFDAAELPQDVSDQQKNQWLAAVDAWTKLKRQAAQADTLRQSAMTHQRQAAAQVAALQRQLTQIEERLGALKVTPSLAEDARRRLREHEAAQREAAAARARVELLERLLADRRQKVEEASRKMNEARRGGRWLTLLRTLREAFHRDCLPAIVHRRALRAILERTNEFLEQFEAPFHVTGSDDLEILAHKGEVKVPAVDLSGGEKMVLGTVLVSMREVARSVTSSEVVQALRVTRSGRKVAFCAPGSVRVEHASFAKFARRFLDGAQRPPAVYVLGHGRNAALVAELWQRLGATVPIHVGSSPLLRRDDSAAQELEAMRRVGRGGWGWHRLSPPMVVSYALRAALRGAPLLGPLPDETAARIAELLPAHPAFPALTFQAPRRRDLWTSHAVVAAAILDPRWHYDPADASAFGRVQCKAFGLGSARALHGMTTLLRRGDTNAPTRRLWKLKHLAQSALGLFCPEEATEKRLESPQGEPLHRFVLRGCGELTKRPAADRLHRAAWRYLDFVCSVWLDRLHPTHELFVPEYFFDAKTADLWRQHVSRAS